MSTRRTAPVDEVACRLERDGRALHVFHCTPERYIELALGWLIGEGMVSVPVVAPPELRVRWDAEGPVVCMDALPGASSEAENARAAAGARMDTPTAPPPPPPLPSDLASAFRELYARAHRYHDAGGIHACAVVEGDALVAHAEDVGRHNAVDKVIGEAVLAGHDLSRCGLVTTARVSGAMSRKAVRAGVGWIASRSVPTTLALSIAQRAGMTIVARAAGSDARVFAPDQRPLGVILAGGRNRRFGGRAKALEEVGGRRIIDRAVGALRPLCADVVMIANEPSMYPGIELQMRPDGREGAGPVGGVREAVTWARERGLPGALVVACDMPFVPASLLAALWRASEGADGAVAESGGPRGVEPLCAAYRTSSLATIEHAIERADLRVIGFFDDADIRRVGAAEVARHGEPDLIFFNVNTAEELERARALATAPLASPSAPPVGGR